MIQPELHLAFAGRDWQILKRWLEETKAVKVGLLIAATEHDKSNQIRGSLSMIDAILALETAAHRAAQQG